MSSDKARSMSNTFGCEKVPSIPLTRQKTPTRTDVLDIRGDGALTYVHTSISTLCYAYLTLSQQNEKDKKKRSSIGKDKRNTLEEKLKITTSLVTNPNPNPIHLLHLPHPCRLTNQISCASRETAIGGSRCRKP